MIIVRVNRRRRARDGAVGGARGGDDDMMRAGVGFWAWASRARRERERGEDGEDDAPRATTGAGWAPEAETRRTRVKTDEGIERERVIGVRTSPGRA